MDEQTLRSQSDHVRESALKMAAPLQTAVKKMYFDLPLAMLSETMRFAGKRLQAQGEFMAHLKTCRTIPDVMEAHSAFVRTAADDYHGETVRIANNVRSIVNHVD